MRKFIWSLALCSVLSLPACVTTQPGYWVAPERADLNRQKDALECVALASQAAQGAGGWSSVAPVRAAIYDEAKAQYYVQCLQSRGYQWVQPR